MTDVFVLGETDENCIRNDDIKTDMDLPASRECTFFCSFELDNKIARAPVLTPNRENKELNRKK